MPMTVVNNLTFLCAKHIRSKCYVLLLHAVRSVVYYFSRVIEIILITLPSYWLPPPLC